jgi:hypothetical protein
VRNFGMKVMISGVRFPSVKLVLTFLVIVLALFVE